MKHKKPKIFAIFLLLNFIPQIFVLIAQPDNLLNWYSSDDAFYYFKTAQNISEGKGITFDGISPTNGFHPLWMMICVPVFALARYDLYLPLRILAGIQIILNAATGFFIFSLISEKINIKIAWLTGLFWMYFLPIHEQTTRLGLETGLTACMLAAYLYQLSRIAWDAEKGELIRGILLTSLCGIGVLLSRLDNIFLLIMTGVWVVFHGKRINKISQIDFTLITISAVVSYFIRLTGYENIFDYLSFLYLLLGFSLIIKPVLLYLFGSYKRELSGKVLIRESILFGVFLSLVAWLQLGRILTNLIIVIISVGFLLLEMLLRMVEKATFKANEYGES